MHSTTKIQNFSAAILAGGKNSRFKGINKSFLKFEDQYIIDRILNILSEIFSEIIIVSNQKELYNYCTKARKISDTYTEIGPLGGIHAALQNSSFENVFIVSCDMPFLNNTLIMNQIDFHNKNKSDITIPVVNNFKEPLHGIYNKNILTTLDNYILTSGNYKIRGLFELVNVAYFKVKDLEENILAFTNINNPEDYNYFLKKSKNENNPTDQTDQSRIY
ncbi:MAG: molybdenum cofactor guanylyltransferase [Bacteroidales bacterium]